MSKQKVTFRAQDAPEDAAHLVLFRWRLGPVRRGASGFRRLLCDGGSRTAAVAATL